MLTGLMGVACMRTSGPCWMEGICFLLMDCRGFGGDCCKLLSEKSRLWLYAPPLEADGDDGEPGASLDGDCVVHDCSRVIHCSLLGEVGVEGAGGAKECRCWCWDAVPA